MLIWLTQPKVTQIDKMHKIHPLILQGHIFPGRQSAAGPLIGHTILKVTRTDKTHKVHALKLQGYVFLRLPKCCRHAAWAHKAHEHHQKLI
jgi:hypothetical protein